MSGILSKYKDLIVIDNRQRTNDLLVALGNLSDEELKVVNDGSHFIGRAMFRESPGEQAAVLEVVMSMDDTDCFATLFQPHPLFNSRDSFKEGREELLTCILDIADASILGVQIQCPLRQRRVDLRDLGTKQLLELLESSVNRFKGK